MEQTCSSGGVNGHFFGVSCVCYIINFAFVMTDTIQIRPWVHADANALAAGISNKKIWDNLRDYIPHPYSLADARDYIALQQGINPAQNFAPVLF
jgi:hypothetical protein